MGIIVRRKVPLGRKGRTWVNVSKSGLSVSHRRGRATVNTRGNFFYRIARGVYYRKHL